MAAMWRRDSGHDSPELADTPAPIHSDGLAAALRILRTVGDETRGQLSFSNE